MEEWPQKKQQNKIQLIKEKTAKMDSLAEIATKLALLIINQPHRINEEIINSFQNSSSQKNQLLAITTWASFTKATKIGTWLTK